MHIFHFKSKATKLNKGGISKAKTGPKLGLVPGSQLVNANGKVIGRH